MKKRQFARIQWLIPCYFESSEKSVGWGMIRNISVGGAEFATRFDLPLDLKIFLNFQVGVKTRFKKLEARIVQQRKIGIYNVCSLDFGKEVDHVVLEKAMKELLSEQLEEI